jgi:hypothetical protein
MNVRNLSRYHPLLAKASIWTITHHDFLAGHIRIYVWYASAVLLFLSVAGLVPLKAALTILLICGLSIMIILWTLIVWRKMILLSISDEALKREAHGAMLALIHSRPDAIKKHKHWLGRHLGRKSHQ